MKTSLTKGYNEQQKEEFTRDFNSSAAVRGRITELAKERIEASWKESVSKDAYTSPSWGLLQADARGYERALSEIISLLEN